MLNDLEIKKNLKFHTFNYIELQFLIAIVIFITMSNIIYASHAQGNDIIEIITKHDHFHVHTILEAEKTPKLQDVLPLMVNLNASYVSPTEITLQPMVKLDDGTWYKINPITKTTVGINQTLNHQFFIPLKYSGNNQITLQIIDSNEPNKMVETDVVFDPIRVQQNPDS